MGGQSAVSHNCWPSWCDEEFKADVDREVAGRDARWKKGNALFSVCCLGCCWFGENKPCPPLSQVNMLSGKPADSFCYASCFMPSLSLSS